MDNCDANISKANHFISVSYAKLYTPSMDDKRYGHKYATNLLLSKVISSSNTVLQTIEKQEAGTEQYLNLCLLLLTNNYNLSQNKSTRHKRIKSLIKIR